MNVLDVLRERGFLEQTTHDHEMRHLLGEDAVTCYIGFDPTASSLHVGSLIPIMALAHMQLHGHRPIALLGGGTGLVGDPSGKTETRKMLTEQDVTNNVEAIKEQLARFLDFDKGRALLLNNAAWLKDLKYIPFLREIGRYFSVNRMIRAESYRMRLESDEGLNFIEFNYMLLQAYDFLQLFDSHGCRLQMGGSDQWGNIVAGVDLVRRMRQAQVYGITFPLITTSGGAKMGKTAQGAVWLDRGRTSPYEYYQYWVNSHDEDVFRFLCLFTLLPMEEISQVKEMEGEELNGAKAVLAFEATCLAHGHYAACEALESSARVFGGKRVGAQLMPSSSIPRSGTEASGDAVPQTLVDRGRLRNGIPAFELFCQVGLAGSKGAAKRLIQQGGANVNGTRIQDHDALITEADVQDGHIILRAGKKRYHKIVSG